MAFQLKKKAKANNVPIDLETKRKLIAEVINTAMAENEIILKDAMNRNVIFVGKTKSGKSTALAVMKNPFHFASYNGIFSDTVDAKISHFTVEVPSETNDRVNFNISVIDTPGLFEAKQEGDETRDNEALEEIVLKCMKEEITKIHSIFFVVSNTGSVNPQDIEALAEFIKLFEGAESHVHVLITRCEKSTDEDKEKFENEIRNYPRMKELLKKINPKIFFFGAVEKNDYDHGFVESLKLSLNNVLELRQTLFEYIFANDKSFELNTLQMIDGIRAKSAKLYEELKVTYQKRDTLKDGALLKFKHDCKTLFSQLPLLDISSYDSASLFLKGCTKFLEDKEREKKEVSSDEGKPEDESAEEGESPAKGRRVGRGARGKTKWTPLSDL